MTIVIYKKKITKIITCKKTIKKCQDTTS